MSAISSLTHAISLDPYTGEQIGAYPFDTDAALEAALPRAKVGYRQWRHVSLGQRSEYLLAVGANGYNGGDGGIAWKLPVYADAFGQLDGSIFYRISDNVQIGLEMNNLNNAEQRTIMEQVDAGRHVTSWFVNDRRYAATIRRTF